MVEFAQFANATTLAGEYRTLGMALDNLAQGGRIVAMRIAPPAPAPPPGGPPPPMMGTEVPTAGIDYPPQMVDAIKAALTARRDALGKELAGLGITGLDDAQRKGK